MTSTPLTLIAYRPALGLRNASPFCLKTEVLLTLAGVPFDIERWGDPTKAPKGKLPVLRDGDALIADSSFITKHLEAHHGLDLDRSFEGSLDRDPVDLRHGSGAAAIDKGHTQAELAVAHAFAKLCEEHLYWAIVYSRWIDPDSWPTVREAYFRAVPAMLRTFVAARVRKGVLRDLQGQGLGRHSREEVYAIGADALDALAAQLDQGPYLLGERLCTADATVYAFLSSILDATLRSPLYTAAQSHPSLSRYTARVHDAVFGARAQVAA